MYHKECLETLDSVQGRSRVVRWPDSARTVICTQSRLVYTATL